MLPLPREGMIASVRNRRGVITSVEPADGPEGRLHLVRIDYTDHDGAPDDALIWEYEPGCALLEPRSWPDVDGAPAQLIDLQAIVRAARWSATTPFLTPDGTGPLSAPFVASPFHGAVQAEDFQLVPLLKALQMPRVSLLLADDVGLGKTVEAGLILSELLLRRRIRRVLVITPATLRFQWQEEMRSKFSIDFDVVDRARTQALQRDLGLDANPWRTFPRVIASYHYLRQPDVLEQLRSTFSEPGETRAQLPWDLLVVDEAHNLMPAASGPDTDLAEMLRQISPWFEHKLFLTATPHNGHTACFTGLLELLDPVRFHKTVELDGELRRRVDDLVVRRLKREINALDAERGSPQRFPDRQPRSLQLHTGRAETRLSAAVSNFRTQVRAVFATGAPTARTASRFAVEVLSKRLLSCPSTFADSWTRVRLGLSSTEDASDRDVLSATAAGAEEISDDTEREGRGRHAAAIIGTWLKPAAARLSNEIAEIDAALEELDLAGSERGSQDPRADVRFEVLIQLVDEKLRRNREWLPGRRADAERLILFTEYKTTLDYLVRRLRAHYKDTAQTAVRALYGGDDLDQADRDAIKAAFNDSDDPVRILVATDTASEGLNLQETARLILHYDIPWNPSRIEQRNGRLDRHGQARDVVAYHFTSEDDSDLRFLDVVVHKVDQIRSDLGSMGDVFDRAFEQRFLDGVTAERLGAEIDRNWKQRQSDGRVYRSTAPPVLPPESTVPADELDYDPTALSDLLRVAVGSDRLKGPDGRQHFRLDATLPTRFQPLVDDLRLRTGARPLPDLIFDPTLFVRFVDTRPVFRPEKDTTLLHLGHPLLRQALHVLAESRFPGTGHEVSRWAATVGPVPRGDEALILMTVEEMALNALREPFHHWVRTLRFGVRGGRLESREHAAPRSDRPFRAAAAPLVERARDLWLDATPAPRKLLEAHVGTLGLLLRTSLATALETSLIETRQRFKHRRKEVEQAIATNTLKRLEKEIAQKRSDLDAGGFLFDADRRLLENEVRQLEEERKLRDRRLHDLLNRLSEEQQRTLQDRLPKRFALLGEPRVFPIAVEIRFPEAAS